MKHILLPSTLLALSMIVAGPADRVLAQQSDPIRIGVNTAIQAQVGRDAIDSVKMAIDGAGRPAWAQARDGRCG
jgi:hypothetical protein